MRLMGVATAMENLRINLRRRGRKKFVTDLTKEGVLLVKPVNKAGHAVEACQKKDKEKDKDK